MSGPGTQRHTVSGERLRPQRVAISGRAVARLLRALDEDAREQVRAAWAAVRDASTEDMLGLARLVASLAVVAAAEGRVSPLSAIATIERAHRLEADAGGAVPDTVTWEWGEVAAAPDADEWEAGEAAEG